MKQGIEITRAVEDQSAFIPEERTSELGRIIEKDEGRVDAHNEDHTSRRAGYG